MGDGANYLLNWLITKVFVEQPRGYTGSVKKLNVHIFNFKKWMSLGGSDKVDKIFSSN